MLRIVQNSSSGGAKTYFSSSDYYTEGQELQGVWRGKAAERLGLSGTIAQADWDALCDNLDPRTGLPLTVRRRQDRRVGFDFNFHAPKSLSLLYGLTSDPRLLEAFESSVHETMCEMEREMQTRVRMGGKNEDRVTGNLVWGQYIHKTSRPVDGVPDPHLHIHAFAFNSTWDPVEERFKAGQFAGIKRDAPYFEAVFHSKLARRVSELGFSVQRTKAAWEIAGFDAATLKKFSRRTTQIEQKAAELAAIAEREYRAALARGEPARREVIDKTELGAKTREKKVKNLTMDQLRSEWWSRLTTDEQRDANAVVAVNGTVSAAGPVLFREVDRAAEEAARHAIGHCFERESVVPERKLLREALRRSFGAASRESVESAVSKADLIFGDRDGRRLLTTREVLAEETALLAYAREGKGTLPPLVAGEHTFKREWLNAGQKLAVKHVLNSNDRVVLIRGAAGVGKTKMMQEAAEAIRSAGVNVFTFAPSSDATEVLRSEGFADAQTIARLLVDEKLQQSLRGGLMWVDESSLVGSRTMKQLFDLAHQADCRVVLSGDRYQHASVERGSALRLLEEEAGLRPAEITEIMRQSGKYKKAVKALSEGRTADGFQQLDRMGSICEYGDEVRYKVLAGRYVDSVMAGRETLVVSPTHLEGEWVAREIRHTLKEAGVLSGPERLFYTLDNANLTVAERSDPVSYLPGDSVVFHNNAPGGHVKGERLVAGRDQIPLDAAGRFTAYRPGILALSAGDRVRITKNGKSREGKRLSNGDLFTVKGFTKSGDIQLAGGVTLAADFRHMTQGYVLTSHASEGKSVDYVIVAQSSQSFGGGGSEEQFYVSVSRGKKGVEVLTDDRAALLELVQRSSERMTATEFVDGNAASNRIARRLLQKTEPVRPPELRTPARGREGIAYDR